MDETSAIARKLQNYIIIENEEPRERYQREIPSPAEPGIWKNMLLISLMAAAVVLTEMTLVLVKWTKRLEGHDAG